MPSILDRWPRRNAENELRSGLMVSILTIAGQSTGTVNLAPAMTL